MSPQNDHFEEPHPHLPEGEEAPPKHVKTMAMVRWIILGALSLFALVMALNFFGLTPWSSNGGGSVQYHCPMHPTYVSNQPGECPICGMNLVPVGDKGIESHDHSAPPDTSSMPLAKPGQYTCPMHPEIVSDTAGRCPKCNMFLEKVPADSKTFTCPMHPEIESDTSGSCPKCGMDLVEKEETSSLPAASASTSAHADHAATSNVPGLASVTIEPHRLQLIGLRTSQATEMPIGSSLPMTGYVTANEKTLSAVSLRISGWVNKLFVTQTGERVEKGAPLARVYSPEIGPAWQEYGIAREYASQTDAVDPQLKAVRTDMLAMAKFRLRQMGLTDDDINSGASDDFSSTITIRSPATGTVIEKNIVEGQYSATDQPLFVIADLSNVWVVADVYESDLSNVKVGQRVSVTFSTLGNAEYSGEVSFVSPLFSEETRTAQARIVLANPSGQIRPGMYAEIVVKEKSRATLAVPSEAVMDGGAEQYLFVVHDRTHFEPRLVTIGARDNSHTEILSGLTIGEEVVTSANFLIDSESRLKAAIAGMGQTAESHAGHSR